MCRFCKDIKGDLTTPVIDCTTKFGKEYSNLTVWIKNNDEEGLHQLVYDVDFFDKTIVSGALDINYCPICGRNLKIE